MPCRSAALPKVWPQHLEDTHFLSCLLDHYMQVLVCQHECVRELATRPGRLSPIENFLPLHYDYLQFAYYRGKVWTIHEDLWGSSLSLLASSPCRPLLSFISPPKQCRFLSILLLAFWQQLRARKAEHWQWMKHRIYCDDVLKLTIDLQDFFFNLSCFFNSLLIGLHSHG